jgi:hypothetical protein
MFVGPFVRGTDHVTHPTALQYKDSINSLFPESQPSGKPEILYRVSKSASGRGFHAPPVHHAMPCHRSWKRAVFFFLHPAVAFSHFLSVRKILFVINHFLTKGPVKDVLFFSALDSGQNAGLPASSVGSRSSYSNGQSSARSIFPGA